MSKFSDSPYFILEDYFTDVVVPYGTAFTPDGNLHGGCSGIIARGGYGIDLFLKVDTVLDDTPALVGGYKRLKSIPISGYPSDNVYRFRLDTTGVRGSEMTFADLAYYGGYEIYFRKDYLYHDYVDSDADYDDFVNTKKVFLYFGELIPVEAPYFTVIFNGMKDYAAKCLPEHNATDNIKEFFRLYFDKIHQKPFNLLKNIHTLSDPNEVKYDYLEYIANMFSMNLITGLSDQDERKYVESLPDLLKRKGTYSSYYDMYRQVLGKTDNYLNIYERWHDPLPEGVTSPYAYFEDILHTMYTPYNTLPPTGGAGTGFYWSAAVTGADGYPTYDVDTGKILSPHFRCEIDLSSEPFGEDFIFDEDTYDELIENWAQIKPVARYFWFSLLSSPITDFTERYISLYGSSYAAYMQSKCCVELSGTFADCVFYKQTYASSLWIVPHNFDTPYVIVQCFDENLEMIHPAEIEYYTMNSIAIRWSVAQAGYCFVTKPDYTHTELAASAAEWVVNHVLNEQYLIATVTDSTYDVFFPQAIEATDANNMTVRLYSNTAGTAAVVRGEYTHTQSTSAASWVITHNLDAQSVMAMFYDDANGVIYPTTFELLTPFTCRAIFAEDITGTAVIKKIAQGSDTMSSLMESLSYCKLGRGGTEVWIPEYYNDLQDPYPTQYPITGYTEDDDYYYVNIAIPTTGELNIKEIGLFDGSDNIIWFTRNSELYKPIDTSMIIFYRIGKVLG
jgi:hypothetical protein